MAPRETENNAYAKFGGDKQTALWYVMLFSGVVNCPGSTPLTDNPEIMHSQRFPARSSRDLQSGYLCHFSRGDMN